MNFNLTYKDEIAKEKSKSVCGPHNYVWCTPDLAYTFRDVTLRCYHCDMWTGFRFIDDCEIPVCSDECLTQYQQAFATDSIPEQATTANSIPEQPQNNPNTILKKKV